MTWPSETATNHQLAAWRGEDAGTEELRTAVRHYRAFGNRLADFSRGNLAPPAAGSRRKLMLDADCF